MPDQCFWNRRIFVLFTFMNTNTFVIVLVSWNSKVILRKENTHNLLKYLILAKPLVQKLLIGPTNEISTLPIGLDIDNRIINLCLFAYICIYVRRFHFCLLKDFCRRTTANNWHCCWEPSVNIWIHFQLVRDSSSISSKHPGLTHFHCLTVLFWSFWVIRCMEKTCSLFSHVSGRPFDACLMAMVNMLYCASVCIHPLL